MAKHHITHKEPHWRRGVVINGIGAVLSLIVDVIIAITKFTHGAWVIVVLVPLMVVFLVRLARQYELEDEQLAHGVPEAVNAAILRRHVVLVFIDELDLAAARAVQYARTLTPDELRAVHFAIDPRRAQELAEAWTQHGMSRIALDLVDCPDRRLTRAAVDFVARDVADGQTEVSVLLPDRKYRGVWHRILHDQTAEAIERGVSQLAHANVTTVPFHFGTRDKRRRRVPSRRSDRPAAKTNRVAAPHRAASQGTTVRADGGVTPIGDVRWRQQVTIEGRVHTVRVQPTAGTHAFECVVEDATGAMSIIFPGRSHVAGIEVGTRLRAQGLAGEHKGRLTIYNPVYTLLAAEPRR
jgi:hypothetical protein